MNSSFDAWDDALGWLHEDAVLRQRIPRWEAAGLTPAGLSHLLVESLALRAPTPLQWAQTGTMGMALLAVEMDEAADLARRRAAAIRAQAIGELAQDLPIAQIARDLGQTRQAVSRAANGTQTFLEWAADTATRARHASTDREEQS